ncbi:MAG: PHP domain-containing protein [Bryobacterales bacterium]
MGRTPIFMVDLHSHTDCSDGLFSPGRLVELACNNRLSALGITDHDTLDGYDQAVPHARAAGLDLVCGIELSGRFRGKTVHVLGYFLEEPAGPPFRRHIAELKQSRRDRNRRLAERLRSLGLDVTLEEAERLGKDQTGRPHFARLLMQKGYVENYRDAFDRYLDESAPGFVERDEPSLRRVFGWILESNGIPVWAHPGRFIANEGKEPSELFAEIADHGCLGIEAYHRDHTIDQAERFVNAARGLGMGVTGGSDFHGPAPNGVPLGGLRLPDSLLEEFRSFGKQALETMAQRKV